MKRFLVLFACLAAVGVASLVWKPQVSAGADSPFVPASDTQVLERLPTGATDPRTRARAALRRELAQNPQNLRLAIELARANIEESRARSDPRYLGYAQAALAPWWDLREPPTQVLVLRATIRQSSHDFEGALADLDAALVREPDDVQALLTRSVVLTVRGDYAGALAGCEPVARASALAAAVCAESVRSMTGDARGAYDRLSRMIATDPQAGEAEKSWAASTLGEIAQRAGDLPAAERELTKSLAIDPGDPYVSAALADLLIDTGRAAEAAKRLAGAQADGLLLRLAIAEARAGLPGAREHTAELRGRFEASHKRGDTVHRREESRFALALEHDPERALPLAVANWDVQKEPWDARVLLEAAIAAKKPAAAKPVIDWLARTHFEDPLVNQLAAQVQLTGGAR